MTKDVKIKFTNIWDTDIDILPVPAGKQIPVWYKDNLSTNSERTIFDYASDNSFDKTIKHCIPIFDAITSGYIIFSPSDLVISQQDGKLFYSWFGKEELLGFHPKQQLELYPNLNLEYIPKWFNPWAITTEKGYSCLFTHPFHRDDLPFTTLTGIVDTDNFSAPVNFPFILKDNKFEGLIPAGTPIVQIIPFKRESWKMEFGNEKDKKNSHVRIWKLSKLRELSYKILDWNKKSYQ